MFDTGNERDVQTNITVARLRQVLQPDSALDRIRALSRVPVIVRQAGDTLQLITQPDHARLAGAIMQHSVALAAHARRASILLAIAEHDNGWTEPDAAPLIDPATGIPLDFISAPIAVRQGVWPRGVARLAHDPWAAALVAHHAIAIFERYRERQCVDEFFAEMETMRQAMLCRSTCRAV